MPRLVDEHLKISAALRRKPCSDPKKQTPTLDRFFHRLNEPAPLKEGMVAKRVFYEGRVQGVGFRFSVKSITTGYEVVGSVKNLIDGRVELLVQGEVNEVEEFLQAILDSHLRRHINRFVIHEIPVQKGLKGFEIRS